MDLPETRFRPFLRLRIASIGKQCDAFFVLFR